MRLSQCMIVKNEEKNIEKALSWGKEILWEQIVVDTGSTDRTVELAKRLGAKVFYFPWQDDFSAAKNFAISKASGDWIAFLDADEYFPQEDIRRLPALLEQYDSAGYCAVMTSCLQVREDESVFSGGSQVRLFKKMEGLGYRNRIHEELFLLGGEIAYHMADATNLLAIYHTGYAGGNVRSKEKAERNIRLLLMDLEEQPDNYRLMSYIGDSYFGGPESGKAKEWFEKAIRFMPPNPNKNDGLNAMTFENLMLILMEEKKEKELLALYEDAVRRLPEESDFDYIMGRFYVEKRKFEKAAFHLQKSLSILENYGNANRGMLVLADLPGTWELLARCYFQIGALGNCVKCCVALLKADSYRISALALLFQAFQKEAEEGRENAAQVLAFIQQLYNLEQSKDRFLLVRVTREIGYGSLEKLLREKCPQEELQAFDEAVKQHEKQKNKTVSPRQED